MQARALASVAILALAACKSSAPVTSEIKVAAASDLAQAFPELGAAFEAKTKTKVTFSFGSSGLLAKQMIEGAPFDLFAAANVAFIDDTIKAGICKEETKVEYALGRLVIWWKKDAAAAPPKSIPDLSDNRFQKIAVANPEHAPYGKAAIEALTRAGVYDAVKPKLVFGENIQQTFQYAQSGNADVALVSLSLATDTPSGAHLEIDAALHEPIHQALAVCGDRASTQAAGQFASFITSSEGRAIMRRHGFLLPE
jgi:molybdate transport system substrate-binding protein